MPNTLPNTEPNPVVTQDASVQDTPSTDSTGVLVVSVFTANQLYPVVGAQVTVTEENSDEILASSTTDRSGRTTQYTLTAPSASMSQEPTVAIPFAEYKVTVAHPDFFEAVIENVQIFGDVLTQLPVNLVPLPELSDGKNTNIVVIPRQNL